MKPKYYLYIEQEEVGATANDLYEFSSREDMNTFLADIGKFNNIVYMKIISGFTLEERKI